METDFSNPLFAVAFPAVPVNPFEALGGLGGEGASNVTARAVARVSGIRPDPGAALGALGGAGATNKLALALAAFVSTATPTDRQNLTARYLGERYREIVDDLRRDLGYRMRKSKEMRLLDDHIQGFLARMVERDYLAPHLAAGLPVKMAVLRVWCRQFASTETRGWGTDAALRTTRGARTARERGPGGSANAAKPVAFAETAREVVTNRDSGPSEAVDRDLWDPQAEAADEALVVRERKRSVLRLLRRLNNGDTTAHVAVVRGLLAGRSLEELTALHGLNAGEMSAFADKVRGLLATAD